jgi:NTP pyrophosphatase (non-canonical NTP hydrolase)
MLRQNPPAGRVYPPGGVIGMRVLRRDRIGASSTNKPRSRTVTAFASPAPSLGTAPCLWRCDIVRKVDLDTMRGRLNEFVIDRGWQHLHTPKNLASAIAVEAGELLAIFQWMTPEESWQVMNDARRASLVRDELIDVLSNLLMFATVLQIDFGESFETKLISNAQRYPIGDQ